MAHELQDLSFHFLNKSPDNQHKQPLKTDMALGKFYVSIFKEPPTYQVIMGQLRVKGISLSQ